MFSGALLRSILCLVGLSVMAYYNVRYFKRITKHPEKSLGKGLDISNMSLSKPIKDYRVSGNNWVVISVFIIGLLIILYGVFNLNWYLNELSAVFLMIALVCGLVSRMDATTMSETVLKSVSIAAPGAFMVGFATSIKVLMEMGNIGDTINTGKMNLIHLSIGTRHILNIAIKPPNVGFTKLDNPSPI